jgi:hypothetical protein
VTTFSTMRPDALARQARRRLDRPREADGFRRETFVLPREEARAKAREQLSRFPKAAYATEIEFWRELPDDRIEFTIRRLPSAD